MYCAKLQGEGGSAGRRLEEAQLSDRERARIKSRGQARQQRLAKARSRKAEIEALDSVKPRAHQDAEAEENPGAKGKRVETIDELRKLHCLTTALQALSSIRKSQHMSCNIHDV